MTDKLTEIDNNELMEEVRARITANSLSEREINNLTFAIIKQTGKCLLCSKMEVINKLMELSDEELQRFLAVRGSAEENIRYLALKQRVITDYQARARNKKTQAELKDLGEASLEDVFTKLDKKSKK